MENQRKKPGRKPGKKIKPPTIQFQRRVTPEEYKDLDEFLKNMRAFEKMNKGIK